MSRSATSRVACALPPVKRLVDERDALRAEASELRRTNRELLRERDRLLRRNRALAETEGDRTPGLDYVFIATYGRSGSTLLQGILNSTPGYLIRGENDGVLYHLFRFHQLATARRLRLKGRHLTATHPYFGIDDYPEQVALQRLRAVVIDTLLRPAADTRVTGVKEIRWDQPYLLKYAAFLRQLFPGARFIVNTRDHDEVRQSKWWARRPDALEQIGARESKLMRLAESLGEDAYQVHYNDYVSDPTVLTDLFSWLGEDFDVDRVRRTMAQRHSY